MDGRLKTLHPKVHGGILCRHDNPRGHEGPGRARHPHLRVGGGESLSVRDHRRPQGRHLDEAIEQIDIGGPTMVRAAAEEPRLHHHRHQRRPVLGDSRSDVRPTAAPRWSFAAGWPARPSPTRPGTIGRSPTSSPAATAEGPFPGTVTLSLTRKMVLRYGENPHQQAALYARPDCRRGQRGRRPATARQGAFLQQPARSRQRPGDRPPVRRAGRRGHQAQQSLRRGRGRRRWPRPCSGPWTAIR